MRNKAQASTWTRATQDSPLEHTLYGYNTRQPMFDELTVHGVTEITQDTRILPDTGTKYTKIFIHTATGIIEVTAFLEEA